jgi:hypothetical protein
MTVQALDDYPSGLDQSARQAGRPPASHRPSMSHKRPQEKLVMCAASLAHLANGGDGLDPVSRAAVERLKASPP